MGNPPPTTFTGIRLENHWPLTIWGVARAAESATAGLRRVVVGRSGSRTEARPRPMRAHTPEDMASAIPVRERKPGGGIRKG